MAYQIVVCGSIFFCHLPFLTCMSRKGPEVGKGMLDFVEVVFVGVKSH